MTPAPTALKRLLILPDIHAPYHDARAWRLVMKVARAFAWDTCLSLGDFHDFYAVSFHPKNPNREHLLERELRQARPLVHDLNTTPFAHRIMVKGNHEHRLDRYLMDKAPQLYNLVRDQDLLGFCEGNWRIVEYREDITIGRLYATHDVGSAGALAVFNAYQDNVVTGHDHQMCYLVRGNAKGVAHVSATFGCLGDVAKVDYMHKIKARRNWALGFGVGYLRANGFIYLQPVPIVEYSCVVEGRLFT